VALEPVQRGRRSWLSCLDPFRRLPRWPGLSRQHVAAAPVRWAGECAFLQSL